MARDTRRLGRHGPEISPIGVGALSFSNMYGPATEEDAHAVLKKALDMGITHIDTANIYGMGFSETVIGTFLAKNAGSGEPPFRIATKAAIRREKDGPMRFDNSAEHLEKELDASLGRLGLDSVDLFYIHRRDPEIEIEEVAGTLAGFIKSGKIRGFGFSEIAPSSLRRAAEVHHVAAVQSEYSLATRTPEMGLVQSCGELGTAFVAFSPLSRGLLTDDPPDEARVGQSGFMSTIPRFQGENFKANLAAAARFRQLAAEMGHAASALAVAWLLSRGDHVIPIPGTRSPAHFEEFAAGADIRLSEGDLSRIESVLPVGWARGERYSSAQWNGVEKYG